MPRDFAQHRTILDMIEAALRAAGAPVDNAIDFNDPEAANEEGKYLEHNGLYLIWSSDDNGVDLSASTYPGDTFFPGADGEEHVKNDAIDRISMGWANNEPGYAIDGPDTLDNFPAFRPFLMKRHDGVSVQKVIREFWEAFAAST